MAIVRFDPFRTTRDFDRLANQFFGLATADDKNASFAPSYDIEQHGDDSYMIHVALPGVNEGDIELTAHDGVLTVSSKADAGAAAEGVRPLYRGIGRGKFERHFRLAEHVEVESAKLVNGILSIKLIRVVPEALKPRSIKITTDTVGNDTAPAIEAA